MELALAFFASTFGAGAGAAGAWAAGTTITTAAGVTTPLLAGSSALSILQGAATAASVISTLAGGIGALQDATTGAELTKLQGNAEYLESEQAALRIRRDVVQKVGAARVAFAGSGLDISSGAAVEDDLVRQGAFETAIERGNAESRVAQAQLRARQQRRSGSYDLVAAGAKAAGQAANFGIDIAARG